jgi:hypothetical protein
MLLDLKTIIKSATSFVLGWSLLNQTQVLTSLSRNLYEEYPKDVKFQNSEYFSWFLDPIIVNKNVIRFVLRGNLLNKTKGFYLSQVEFVWEVPLGCQISKFWVIFMVSGPKYSYQKCHQISSTVKFAEQNSRFLTCLGGTCMGGTLRISNFEILSIFSGS